MREKSNGVGKVNKRKMSKVEKGVVRMGGDDVREGEFAVRGGHGSVVSGSIW